MLSEVKCNFKLLLNNIPFVDQYFQEVHRKHFKFQTELKLIKGTHKNHCKRPSILHFSLNKASTQYVKSILRRCALENGMVPAHINDYAFNTNFPFLDHLSAEEMKKYNHIFKSTGYLYSVFGGMIEGIQNLEKYKIVLVIRDPRDILVSDYYSMAYSHPVPNEAGDKHNNFILRRTLARESTLDEYVLSESDRVYNTFSRYRALLIDNHKDIYITTYEGMVSDFESWLIDLVTYCDLNLSKDFIQYLLKENEEKKPKKEDITKHIRKGKPGDYKEKLRPETIQKLNEKFKPILKQYHY